MVIGKHAPSISRSLLLSFLIVLTLSASASAAENLRIFLPGTSAPKGFEAVGEPREAEGQDLFRLINGGAVLFFRHNFRQAIFQEYATPGGKTINLEIYRMESETDAKGIFTIKKDEESQAVGIGQEGSMAGYYGMFRQGAYFITVTGDESTENVRKTLARIAGIVVKKIGRRASIR
ncbi:MAG: hypothetical protein GY866_14770 [Proteobacteria bacterium]|nr:hypothetical protein [Pseudomonadota bacterium]